MYNEYDELDELLEEAYLEGYYDSMNDYDDYYNESRAIGREWLRLHDNAKIADAGSEDFELPSRIRNLLKIDRDNWIRQRDSIHKGNYPEELARGLKGIGSCNSKSDERWAVNNFKDKTGRRTYKDREPGYYLKLQEGMKKAEEKYRSKYR